LATVSANVSLKRLGVERRDCRHVDDRVAIYSRSKGHILSPEKNVRRFGISKHEDNHLAPLKNILRVLGDSGACFRQQITLRGRTVPDH
jgi:hypothetical protein